MNVKYQTQPLDPRCQSRPSARNSFDPNEGRLSKDYGADQQRLQISDPHFDRFTTPATFACWKMRFKTELCTCSQFPTEALLSIKEVEMVESVDDLESSLSTRGTSLNSTLHTLHFLVDLQDFKCHIDIDSRTKVCGAHFMHVSSACCVLLACSRLSLLLFAVHLLSHLLFLLIIFIFHVGDKNPAHF